MKMPEHAAPFWQRFEATQPVDPTPRFFEAFHFDDNEPDADELAQLVLSGRKRATASLLWYFEHAGLPLPRAGSLSVVTTFAGEPVCVIETLSVEVIPFNQVTAEFAVAEGEGDGSLEHWRKVHASFFARGCERIGREPDARMPVVCERSEAVYREGKEVQKIAPLE